VVYEVVRLIDKKLLFFEDHLQRFFDSFQYLDITVDLTKNGILQQLKLLIDSNDVANGNIKFQINISPQKRTQDFYAYFIPHAYPSPEQFQYGVPVSIFHALRLNPNAKVQHIELKQRVEALLKEEKTYEAVLVNQKGIVTEGSRSNLFMIKNNQVYTAQDKDVLPGITRKYVLEACRYLNLPILLQPVTLDELFTMDALFLSGTSPKVLPVNSIYETIFDVRHPQLRNLMKVFDEMIGNNLQPISNFCK
jgi:branched-chain amino acid aminotransferase